MNDTADLELAFHAYIFFGNVLNYLLNGFPFDPAKELDASPVALVHLKVAIHPLTPANILAGIAALSPADNFLLATCCRWCLADMQNDELLIKLGVTHEEAKNLIATLLTNRPIPHELRLRQFATLPYGIM